MTRYRLVAEHRAQWGVEERCRVLQVSRSGYYDWQQRPPSPRAEQTQRLETTIKELFEASQRRLREPEDHSGADKAGLAREQESCATTYASAGSALDRTSPVQGADAN